MERLTFEGDFCDVAMCMVERGGEFCRDGACSQKKTWEQLKAYEDTGLTPEQVEALSKDLNDERYRHDRLQDWDIGMTTELEKYHELEREGRLLVLPPCRVGDTVYLEFYGRIVETVVKGINIGLRGLYITTGLFSPWVDELGKTWFLTREDAEIQLGVELNEKA